MSNLKRCKTQKSKIKNTISAILISFTLSGCAGFSGYVDRLDDGTIVWDANRPCIIEDTKEQIKLDGKGQKLIEFNVGDVNALKKE